VQGAVGPVDRLFEASRNEMSDSDITGVKKVYGSNALHGDRAGLRDHAARHTLAGGRVVDPFPPRRGRRLPARLAVLEATAEADPARALLRILDVDGLVALPDFALVRNLTPAELDSLTGAGAFLRVGPAGAPVALTPYRLAALCDQVVAALAASHRAQPDALGPTRPALLAQLRALAPEAALEAALAQLAAAGRIAREGAAWRLPEHRPRLTQADERLWERVHPLLAVEDLRPPRVREFAAALTLEPEAVERLLKRAERLGRVARVADNRFFLPQTLARLAEIAHSNGWSFVPRDRLAVVRYKTDRGACLPFAPENPR
jgi:selenocysteine-specific elongation factor